MALDDASLFTGRPSKSSQAIRAGRTAGMCEAQACRVSPGRRLPGPLDNMKRGGEGGT